MKLIKKILIVSAVLLVTSCAQFKLIPASELKVKGFSVLPATSWSKSPFEPGEKAEVWTIDGYSLNQMLVFGEIKEGETLLKETSKELPMPKFRAEMLPNELEDLVKTSIINQEDGTLKIETKNVRPQQIGEQVAFRFELEFFDANGLKKNSDVIVWVKDKQLFGMIFTAPTLHYYESYKPALNKTYNSIKA
ncbi:hypothetical protein [Planctobacterium marinum]|uniref:hypothetical protein n=1 Tax=Planctobacterium marinum TaxID=1631968 RepID=UPI001E43DDC0|nr:hypothetical protein [Planctobacterium marinum]MCC2608151.1 hypothetical protein [Planctobacterium marinum]